MYPLHLSIRFAVDSQALSPLSDLIIDSFQYREERFRGTSESTNQRVFWWSITQLAVLVCMGAWQMKHLKSFFEAKKLV